MYRNALGSGFVTPVVEGWLITGGSCALLSKRFSGCALHPVCRFLFDPGGLNSGLEWAWSGLVLDFGSRACDLLRRQVAFVFMDFESGLFELLSWRAAFGFCWASEACAAAFMLLEVLLMCAWAAAAYVEPHALVSVFGVVVCCCIVILLGLVTTTPCHDHKGSRIVFEEAKATPRVVAVTPPGFPVPRGSWETFSLTWSQLGVSSSTPCPCTHWSDSGGAVVLSLDDVLRCVSERTGVPLHAFHLTVNGKCLTAEALLAMDRSSPIPLVLHGRFRAGSSSVPGELGVQSVSHQWVLAYEIALFSLWGSSQFGIP